jgi:hypothetical protein
MSFDRFSLGYAQFFGHNPVEFIKNPASVGKATTAQQAAKARELSARISSELAGQLLA